MAFVSFARIFIPVSNRSYLNYSRSLNCCFSFKNQSILRHIHKYPELGGISRTILEDDTSNSETFYGFERVTEKEKLNKVKSVFTSVASHYDLMNDVMSGGLHHLWKDEFIQILSPTPGTKVLDVAGGTGDIALRFLRAVQNLDSEQNTLDSLLDNQQHEPNSLQSHVVVFDINYNMLREGMKKAQNAGFTKGISWVQGDAEDLPFLNNSFDAYTCAFGIRNMVHIERALSEAHRVLKPGGRFMCLEFSQVTNPIFERIYDWYSFQIIPVMGQLLARDWKSYQYLVESIRKFPDQEEYQAMLEETGFSFVTYKNLLCGVTAIHTGFKL